ncbi:hypothetical protein M2306_003015 [Myroides gitamensis]|uniref:Uncharacterized protein n=1 Tax=Myroides odoratus TaxID=256 RepID=A0A378U1X5_MYROD|nr:hypothetical protein [Myroides odoratus]MCS4239298.1 hypothetical protein [Myroides odoratus]MDH6602321.1 hypothetical protein [Myroides gitamensis]QQU03457.1 hypothetical protein I6I89_16910 [Myroides odoratus]STZ69275.1 Uncharacterised protein [Myroides odoratus]
MLDKIDNDCKETDSRSKFVFQENGRKLTLINSKKVESTKIKIDGCHIQNSTACDFMLVTANDDFYIELKGQDINKALGQVIVTIEEVGKASKNSRKAFVICSKVPKIDTSIQMKKKTLQNRYACDLEIASNQREYKY